jgi:hypothetical protein
MWTLAFALLASRAPAAGNPIGSDRSLARRQARALRRTARAGPGAAIGGQAAIRTLGQTGQRANGNALRVGNARCWSTAAGRVGLTGRGGVEARTLAEVATFALPVADPRTAATPRVRAACLAGRQARLVSLVAVTHVASTRTAVRVVGAILVVRLTKLAAARLAVAGQRATILRNVAHGVDGSAIIQAYRHAGIATPNVATSTTTLRPRVAWRVRWRARASRRLGRHASFFGNHRGSVRIAGELDILASAGQRRQGHPREGRQESATGQRLTRHGQSSPAERRRPKIAPNGGWTNTEVL